MVEVKFLVKSFISFKYITGIYPKYALGYILEKRLSGSENWTKCNTFPILDTEWVVGDLTDNTDYEFRVKAINKAGESEPSYSTGLIKVTEFPGLFIKLSFLISFKDFF
jgi:hypothetical protein